MDLQQTTERIAAIAAQEGPGFFRINDSKAKSYAFYWVNEAGQIVLISKIYRTARSRNKAQQQLENGNYQLETIRFEDRFSYQVINGGDKPMSAGPLFASEAERDAAMHTLPEPLRAGLPEEPPAEQDQAQRHSFRLNFYRLEEKEGTWQGRISYPLTEQKESFQGIDIPAIEQFIRSVLKEPAEQPAKAAEKKQKKRAAASAKPVLPLPKEIKQQPLYLLSQGKKVVGGVLSIGAPVGIEVKLDDADQAGNYRVQVVAKSLNDGRFTQLDSMAVNREQGDALRMPIHTGSLSAGLYRLNAEVVSADTREKKITQATSLVHFY